MYILLITSLGVHGAGLAAAAIPIIVHLFNFRKPREVDFSTLRFLREVERQSRDPEASVAALGQDPSGEDVVIGTVDRLHRDEPVPAEAQDARRSGSASASSTVRSRTSASPAIWILRSPWSDQNHGNAS